jgi:CO/xanthine dehydrogenase FAD-binding subunit
MRSNVPAFQLVAPRTLDLALQMISSEPGVWKPFAGGTDLMVLFEAGKLTHERFVSIWQLDELRGIEVEDEYVRIGALTTYAEIRANEIMQKEFPMLCRAAAETGGLAIQNRGTLGGNIVNGSPAADSPPALLVYEAELELISTKSVRLIPYTGFHLGYKKMDLREDELVQVIRIPRAISGWRQQYRKVGTRKAQAISKVCFAAAVLMDGKNVKDVRIAMGSVAPMVVRCSHAEAALRGGPVSTATIKDAKTSLSRDISPIDDIRSTFRYRQMVAENLLEDFLESLL